MTFDLRNTGAQAGDEIAEVYVTLPTQRASPSASWRDGSVSRSTAGATQTVTVALDPLYLSIYSTDNDKWSRPAGDFRLRLEDLRRSFRCTVR